MLNAQPLNHRAINSRYPMVVFLPIGLEAIWLDEFAWSAVERYAVGRTAAGEYVQGEASVAGGRPITIDLGWVTLTELQEIETLRDNAGMDYCHLMLPDDRYYPVRFADENPITATPVIAYPDYQSGDRFAVTISLITIEV